VALVGFDSAWTAHNRGALCGVVVGPLGTQVLAPTSVTFDEALTAINELGRGVDVRLVAIDQPLVVPNQAGRRFVEAVVSGPIGRRLGGVQPANRRRVGMFDAGAPLWPFLAQLNAELDPDVVLSPRRGTFAIEVYPSLANVALFQSPAKVEPLLKYNPERRSFRLGDWQTLLDALRATFDGLGLAAFAQWCADARGAAKPSKVQQDGVDALVCLLTALRWWERGREGCEVVGDVQRGYMVVPVDDALRAELAASAARAAPG
jgi:predicted RNase H-like nuclease